jgi:prepilin-type N-terminal cleavage/methylation domain-containing protein
VVRSSKQSIRYAFTMIELIFAIVIIAISVMSLPMVTQVTARAIENNLAQEAVFSAVAEINLATTYIWDEVSLLDANTSSNELSRVINNNSMECSDSGIDDSNGDDIMRRPGHVHRRCLNDLTAMFYNPAATDHVDSLNAAEHDYNITVEGSADTTSATGYKKEYESRLDVIRGDEVCADCIDFGAANNANMKEIRVTIREKATNDEVTVLRAYSANIGEVAYRRRTL